MGTKPAVELLFLSGGLFTQGPSGSSQGPRCRAVPCTCGLQKEQRAAHTAPLPWPPHAYRKVVSGRPAVSM